MTVFFSKDLREPLSQIDFSDLSECPKYKENEKNIEFSFNEKDLLDIKLDINSAISLIGMDSSQNNVNGLGKQLYQIYDELMIQTKHSE